MQPLLNTLYVTTQGAYLAKSGLAVQVRFEKRYSPNFQCTRSKRSLVSAASGRHHFSWARRRGRRLRRVSHGKGAVSRDGKWVHKGNVFLRRNQYRLADDASVALRSHATSSGRR